MAAAPAGVGVVVERVVSVPMADFPMLLALTLIGAVAGVVVQVRLQRLLSRRR